MIVELDSSIAGQFSGMAENCVLKVIRTKLVELIRK